MTDTQALRDLEKRLSEAKGPDREIDVHLYAAFSDLPIKPASSWCVMDKFQFAYTDERKDRRALYLHEDDVPEFTASLDAAVALCERVLPGRGLMIGRGKTRPSEPLWGVELYADDLVKIGAPYRIIARAESETPALALCLAIVRALLAKEPE